MQDELNISSVHVLPTECSKKLSLFSNEGIVRLEIPSQIAGSMTKIAYSVVTTLEGITFPAADL